MVISVWNQFSSMTIPLCPNPGSARETWDGEEKERKKAGHPKRQIPQLTYILIYLLHAHAWVRSCRLLNFAWQVLRLYGISSWPSAWMFRYRFLQNHRHSEQYACMQRTIIQKCVYLSYNSTTTCMYLFMDHS